jgi:lactate dehydrogenase-like 2-hydroxyacid dehydrogenase
MTSRAHITVTRRLPQQVEDELTQRWNTRLNADDHAFTADELAQALSESDIVLCTLTDHIGAEVFHAASPARARLLANFGVGFEHIDLDAARAAGIFVTNTPGVLTEDTADLTILLMLAVARRTGEGEQELRNGEWTGWRPTHLLGRRVNGRRLGIVGMGRIGQAVAHRAHHGFGMEIHYFSPRALPETVRASLQAIRHPTLAALLGHVDFVSLHCPATPDTRHLIGESALHEMRPGAFLINTSRGDVVDEGALVAALASGHLGGAALDVYEREPDFRPALRSQPNVVLLPHLGSATLESRAAMGRRAILNLEAFLEGRLPPDRLA